MKSLTFLVLTVFIFLSLFGFAGMLSASDMQVPGTCLASLAQNGACPPSGEFGLALFHTGAFKVFSTTLVSVVSLAGLVLLCVYFLVSSSALFMCIRAVRTLSETVRLVISRYTALARLRSTLARFELSPSLV